MTVSDPARLLGCSRGHIYELRSRLAQRDSRRLSHAVLGRPTRISWPSWPSPSRTRHWERRGLPRGYGRGRPVRWMSRTARLRIFFGRPD
jgi:hypothetical protein